MLALCVRKGGLDGLLKLGIFNILYPCGPFCFLVKGILYTCFHKLLDNGLDTFAYIGYLLGSKAYLAQCHRTLG